MDYNDANDLFEIRSDPRMCEHTDTKLDGTIDETKAYIDKMNKGIDDNKWIIWVIEHKKSKRVIGSISIWNINEAGNSGELGYGIIPNYQGLGLMRESLISVVKFGFKVMNLKDLHAYTEDTNVNSIKLLESYSFIEINRVDDEGYFNKKVYRMIEFRLDNRS